ncbi:TPA: hypothetical protein HA241_03260 [Candidatus Woesearchaeota archaeon]|nr:hypothetical protein [Candidatus Woesearchaeota archaeon]
MAKRCIICDENAVYKIKDTADFYCQSCAEDNFGDLSVLVSVEEEALRLKQALEQKLDTTEEHDV